MKKRLLPIYLLCAALAAAAYALLSARTQLTLLPYAKALQLLFGLQFTYTGGAYAAMGSPVVITQSCSGLNLFLSLYAILALGFLHRFAGTNKRLLLALLFFAQALLAAFAATLLRIILSLPFSASPHFKLLHTLLSLCVFFAAGLLLYALMHAMTERWTRKKGRL